MNTIQNLCTISVFLLLLSSCSLKVVKEEYYINGCVHGVMGTMLKMGAPDPIVQQDLPLIYNFCVRLYGRYAPEIDKR